MQRLDRYLSEAGVASRSALREIIRAGRVAVDGTRVTRAEYKLDEKAAVVTLDGVPVAQRKTVVVMLHKPAGYVTSTEDPRDKTVMELLPQAFRALELRPVGRLDKETEGLLLFTNDGELLHRLISPRSGIEKVYYAEHEGQAEQQDVLAFAEGLTLADGTKCRPAQLLPMGVGKSRVTLSEGKYHQVRRMMASRGLRVNYLKRLAEGAISLGDLPCGAVRKLTPEEYAGLTYGQDDEGSLP